MCVCYVSFSKVYVQYIFFIVLGGIYLIATVEISSEMRGEGDRGGNSMQRRFPGGYEPFYH